MLGRPFGDIGENELSKGPSRHTRSNWPRRFWSEPRSEERAYKMYGSDERHRAAQDRPALRGGPSLARGVVASRSHRPAMLPRRASPRSQIWASQLYRVCRDGP